MMGKRGGAAADVSARLPDGAEVGVVTRVREEVSRRPGPGARARAAASGVGQPRAAWLGLALGAMVVARRGARARGGAAGRGGAGVAARMVVLGRRAEGSRRRAWLEAAVPPRAFGLLRATSSRRAGAPEPLGKGRGVRGVARRQRAVGSAAVVVIARRVRPGTRLRTRRARLAAPVAVPGRRLEDVSRGGRREGVGRAVSRRRRRPGLARRSVAARLT